MTIPDIVALLALTYLVNIAIVIGGGLKPYWSVFVPGLPVVIALAWLTYFLLVICFGVVWGLALATAIMVACVRELVRRPAADKPIEEMPVERTELHIV